MRIMQKKWPDIFMLSGKTDQIIEEKNVDKEAMVHPAEISGRDEKTIADFVLDYMMHLPTAVDRILQ